MSAIAGIYAVFGIGSRVYVGESGDVLRRTSLTVPRSLGLGWTIVRYMPQSTRRARCVEEARVMAGYRAAGYNVVSMALPEVVRIMQATGSGHSERWSPERRRTHSAMMRALMAEPERRRALSERTTRMNAERTVAQRSEMGKRAWVTRRAKHPPGGK